MKHPESTSISSCPTHRWWREGRWIWITRRRDSALQHVCFRREVTASRANEAMRLAITADCVYRLHINGNVVMQGPARSLKGEATVDELDLASRMRPGRNVIAVEVIYRKPWEAGYPGQSPGLFVTIRQDDRLIAGPDGWRCCEPGAYDADAPLCGNSRPPVEIFDARRLDPQWKWEGFDDAGWSTPIDFSPPISSARELSPRDVPLPSMEWIEASMPISFERGSGEIGPEFKDTLAPHPKDNFVLRLQNEARLPAPTIEPNADGGWMLPGNSHDMTLDLGRVVCGFISFDIEGPAGSLLELAWHETLDPRDGTVRPRLALHLRQVASYLLREGPQQFTMFSAQTLRYVRLVNRSASSILVRSVGVIAYHVPSPTAGNFVCSDSQLNRIFEAARQTATLNTLDLFMDCPNRERNGWFHDSYWTSSAYALLSGDFSVTRRMCRIGAESFLSKVARDVVAPSVPLADEGCLFIPGHSLFWILQMDLYRRWSGRDDLSAELSEAINRQIRGLERYRNPDGLLEDVPGWNFLDWSLTRQDGVSVGLNALYARALEVAAEITATPEYRARAQSVRDTLDRLCPGSIYPDVLVRTDDCLVPSEERSETTQYYALWCGLADNDRRAALWRDLRDAFMLTETIDQMSQDHPRQNGFTRGSVYSYLQRLHFAATIGDREILLGNIKRTFGHMVDEGPGTLWEAGGHPNQTFSRCQGVSSAVAAILIESILGVTPLEGTRRVRVAPGGAGKLRWCRGFVPAERGRIVVAWTVSDNEFRLSVGLPRETTAQVVLPPEARSIWLQAATNTSFPESITCETSCLIAVKAGSIEFTRHDKKEIV